MRRVRNALDDREGSASVEFVLVGALLTLLTFAVLQFGLAVYVRNVVHDAAVDGAYHAALADTTLAEGESRVREILARTVGEQYVSEIILEEGDAFGQATIDATVHATLPLFGLLGAPRMLKVTAHAPAESFD